MAILHVKTPNGTTKDVNLETMNIESDLQQNGWCKLPNGLIIQWISNWIKIAANFVIVAIHCSKVVVGSRTCQNLMQISDHENGISDMKLGFLCKKCDMTVAESGVN